MAEEIIFTVNDTQEEVSLFVGNTTGVTKHSQLDLDDGTNPHSTTKIDVGLSNVPNTDFTTPVGLNTAKVSFPEAPNDGKQYARKSETWSEVTGGNVVVDITPTDNPQLVFDNAPEGSTLVFNKGVHEWGINNNGRTQNAILYVDKPMNIELMGGAILKLADNTIVLGDGTDAEITINQGGVEKVLDDMIMGATSNYTGGVKIDYYILSDSAGATDTFEWGYFGAGNVQTPVATGVAITGSEQELELGVKIQFAAITGHNVGGFWVISYDGQEHYGIRTGTGFHADYIENINIYGEGTIDLNRDNNVQPSILVANTAACVFVHGRVRYHTTKNITMLNAHRTYMAFGDNNGTYFSNGAVDGGESFDAEYINILYTKSYTSNDEDAGIELGHPSHRGLIKYVKCNDNFIESNNTPIELNYCLREYQCLNNMVSIALDRAGVKCWRRSDNGLVMGNVLIGDETGLKDVFDIEAPAGWETAQNIKTFNNYNLNDGKNEPFPPLPSVTDADSPTANMIANYPLATDSNESLGITSGINGVDTSITYASEAQFNGSTSKINIPHNDIFSFTDGVNDKPFTIALKVKYNDNTTAYLFNKGTNAANREYALSNSPYDSITGVLLSSSGNNIAKAGLSLTRTIGQWYDVILTYDGSGLVSGLKPYWDGVLQTSDISAGTYTKMTNSGEDVVLGMTGWAAAHQLNGSIKDVRIYSDEKSQTGVYAIIAL